MRRLLTVLLTCALAAAAAAAPLPPAARTEVDALLSKLEASGCQFSRNGTWYSSAEARSHLLRKLTYLEGRGAVQTAEQFIELAASRSSSSGKPYHVKCGTEAAVESRLWLSKQLAVMRASARSKPSTTPLEER
jgi:hypothetical protein